MDDKEGLIIVGAGGHAKVVLSTALETSEKVAGFLDDNSALIDTQLEGYPVFGLGNLLASQRFKTAILGLGNNATRKQLAEQYRAIQWKTLVHPAAYVHPSVKLGVGTVVFAGAVVQPHAIVGKHCIINTGATVDHDCHIGDYVHLAPGVHLAGNVRIGEGAFLGIGSVTIPNVTIGNWVIVAAGGVVIDQIADRKTVMGIPAKERG